MKVTGLDLSLTGTGVARITWTGTSRAPRALDIAVRRFGSIPAGDNVAARSARLRGMAHQACTHCAGSDLVVIESPAYGSVTGHMHDRSGLWWLVVARLTANSIPVVEVTPQQLKMYALGKGGGANTGKDQVLAAVVRRYPHVDITTNDTADALVLAAMGARHLGSPIEPDLPALHLRALAKLAWPT